jgi:multiple antibiotic resistance protein
LIGLVLLVSLFVGSEIMRFFGISMAALRIAGGLVVAATAWSMLHATPSTADHHASANYDTYEQSHSFH